MDTFTQALLGGAVGFAVAGRVAPRRALLWGAAIAVLPDLDVFIPHDNELEAITHHRGWTHSWLVQSVVAPLLAWLLHRLDNTLPVREWWLLAWLALITHSALDALTVYGTQLFWPYPSPPVMIGSVFIIDPLYSLPLLVGFLGVVFFAHSPSTGHLNRAMLTLSTLYLIWGLAAQQWVIHQVQQSLAKSGIEPQRLLVTPSAFNSVLWRILVIDGADYLEGFSSLLDKPKGVELRRHHRHLELLQGIAQLPSLQRFEWFSHGFYAASTRSPVVLVRDLRMGSEPYYPFQFKLGSRTQDRIEPTEPERVRSGNIPEGYFNWLWKRIWSQEMGFHQ